jgi:hypothetical protein
MSVQAHLSGSARSACCDRQEKRGRRCNPANARTTARNTLSAPSDKFTTTPSRQRSDCHKLLSCRVPTMFFMCTGTRPGAGIALFDRRRDAHVPTLAVPGALPCRVDSAQGGRTSTSLRLRHSLQLRLLGAS